MIGFLKSFSSDVRRGIIFSLWIMLHLVVMVGVFAFLSLKALGLI